jgi:hypothetical protein
MLLGRTTEPNAPLTLAQALPAKLTEVQAGQALDPVLRQIGQTSGPDALRTLAQALQALAAKLTDAQAVLASKAAAASLAWAADDEEAAEWARALVTLSRPAEKPRRRRLLTAHANSGRSRRAWRMGQIHRDQRAIAQADHGRNIDAVEQLAGLFGREHCGLDGFDDVLSIAE